MWFDFEFAEGCNTDKGSRGIEVEEERLEKPTTLEREAKVVSVTRGYASVLVATGLLIWNMQMVSD